MTKPVAAAIINTEHSLATDLVACWPMLEGTGLFSADKTGNGYDLALDPVATSWTTESGDLVIAKTDNTNRGSEMARSLVLSPASTSFSIAWRGKQTADDGASVFIGRQGSANPVIRMGGSVNALRIVTGSGTINFTKTLFTTTEDHLLTFDVATGELRYYVNGSENASSPIIAAVAATLRFDSVLGGQTGSIALVGLLHYLYVWENRVLSGAEAVSLSSDPYVFLTDRTTAFSTEYRPNGTDCVKHTFEWVSDASGNVTLASEGAISGEIERVIITPYLTKAPTANYDMTLTDEDSVDVLAGQGANLSDSTSTKIIPGTPLKDGTTTKTVPMVVDGILTLNISNAGDNKSGTVVVYVR